MPGIGGQPQRHRQGQLVIDDRRDRAAGEPGDQHLLVGLGVGDDGKARHLRAGAGGRRDRDDRQTRFRDLRSAPCSRASARHWRPAPTSPWRCRSSCRRRSRRGCRSSPSASRRAPASTTAVVGSATVSENTRHGMPASSRSAVARSRWPERTRKGSVTISGLVKPEPLQQARKLGQRAAADRHQPRHRDHRNHRAALSRVCASETAGHRPAARSLRAVRSRSSRRNARNPWSRPGRSRALRARRPGRAALTPAAPSTPATGTTARWRRG